MTLTIITQDGDFINYNNVLFINQGLGTFEDTSTHEDVERYLIFSTLPNNDFQILGIYETGIKMEQTMASLSNWLEHYTEMGSVFRMPNDD